MKSTKRNLIKPTLAALSRIINSTVSTVARMTAGKQNRLAAALAGSLTLTATLFAQVAPAAVD